MSAKEARDDLFSSMDNSFAKTHEQDLEVGGLGFRGLGFRIFFDFLSRWTTTSYLEVRGCVKLSMER